MTMRKPHVANEFNSRFTRAAVTMLNCTILVGLSAGAASMSLEAQMLRQINVTVTDPLNRFVTGLEREHFEVVQQGVPLSIAAFSAPESQITIALVTDTPLQGSVGVAGPKELLIQTRSLADDLTQLSASTNTRKYLVMTTSTTGNVSIPGGIEAQIVEPANLSRAVIELRNQYVLLVGGVGPSAEFEVVLKQPRGLPTLRPNWKPAAVK